MTTIDYFFTHLSPYSYLGNERFHDVARRHGARIVYKPVRVAVLYPATGGMLLWQRPPMRQAYRLRDLRRMSEYLAIPINLEPKHWLVEEDLICRMILVAQDRGLDLHPLVSAAMRAMWVEDRDISQIETVEQIVASCGFDTDSLRAEAEQPELVERYASITAEAVQRGVFGVPTYAIGEDLFWGQDRIDLLSWVLGRVTK